jgi:hypothetical protein
MAPPSPYQTTPYQPSPYQQQNQTTPYQYQAGASMPPPQQLPIYYPPPPRLPLMKPETAAFMKKTLIAFVLVGTLVILILVGLNAVVDSFRNASRDRMDNNALPDVLQKLPENMPVGEKLSVASGELNKQQSDGRRAEIRHYISMLYDSSGREFFGRADLLHAEIELTNGTQADPNNGLVWGDLASVLQQESVTQQDPDTRASLLSNAGDDFTKAYGLENDTKHRRQDAASAAEAYVSFGQAALDTGDRSKMAAARQKLYDVRQIAPQDDTLRSAISDMLTKLSN